MTTPWRVPRMWEGRAVAVCASGHSMRAEIAEQLNSAGLPIIVVNDTYRLAPFADMLVAGDLKWWRVNGAATESFRGLKVTAQPNCSVPGVLYLRPTGVMGFAPDPGSIRTGNNSGYQAIHIAIQAGAATIGLFGFDMHGDHWFGEHSGRLRGANPQPFHRWIPLFSGLKGRGAEIINCTPGSALKCFPFGTLEEFCHGATRATCFS